MIARILCLVGIHDWEFNDNPDYPVPHHCARCGCLSPLFSPYFEVNFPKPKIGNPFQTKGESS